MFFKTSTNWRNPRRRFKARSWTALALLLAAVCFVWYGFLGWYTQTAAVTVDDAVDRESAGTISPLLQENANLQARLDALVKENEKLQAKLVASRQPETSTLNNVESEGGIVARPVPDNSGGPGEGRLVGERSRWHTVGYLINEPESWCTDRADVETLLVLVPSSPNHFTARQHIRESWGGVDEYGGIAIEVRFFVAYTADAETTSRVAQEAAEHMDIVQQDFVDSYKNLTRKTMGGLQWVSEHCKQADYVLKADDDTFVNIINVEKFLHSRTEDELDSFLCGGKTYKMTVPRNPHSKWYTTKEQWPEPHFPSYCHGFGYFVPAKKIEDILEAADRCTHIAVEDAFMGVVAHTAGIGVWGTVRPKDIGPRESITRPKRFGEGLPLAVLTTKKPTPYPYGVVYRYLIDYMDSMLMVAHVHESAHLKTMWATVQQHILGHMLSDEIDHGLT